MSFFFSKLTTWPIRLSSASEWVGNFNCFAPRISDDMNRIIPQAVSVHHGLSIGAQCSPVVLAMMYLFSKVVKNISKLSRSDHMHVPAPITWPIARAYLTSSSEKTKSTLIRRRNSNLFFNSTEQAKNLFVMRRLRFSMASWNWTRRMWKESGHPWRSLILMRLLVLMRANPHCRTRWC